MKKNYKVVEKHTVSSRHVMCDGKPLTGHPKVYLEIDHAQSIKCPYCSQIFVYNTKKSDNSSLQSF